MAMDKALHLRETIDRIYVSRKKKEEDLKAFKIASMHQYSDSENTSKSAEEDWLQRPETI